MSKETLSSGSTRKGRHVKTSFARFTNSNAEPPATTSFFSQAQVDVATSKAAVKFDRKLKTKFSQVLGPHALSVLTAYLGFKDPRKRKLYLIPKDRAAWLEWMVIMSKRRVAVEYLSDKELRKVIIRARPNLSPHKKLQGPDVDPDLPPCLAWSAEQVGDWIASVGWPKLRETFVKNMITGRRLISIDCSALNQMGMSDLTTMRDIAGKIRDLLGIPPPNGLRPLMRIPPFERFLRRKMYNGRTYDDMTFERFCDTYGYNYSIVQHNKNAEIPCTAEVLITTPDQEDDDEEQGEKDEELSLRNAPTVEFLARNAIVRNKIVDQIMDDILQSTFLPPNERMYGRDVFGKMKRGIGEGYDDLHLYYSKDRLEFASGVANSLIDELYKTVAILNDITQLQKHIKEDISDKELHVFRQSAKILMEDVAPIAALLALGELDLESIFKQEPEFNEIVDGVIREAETKTNELVPEASSLIDEVINDAFKRIPSMDLSGVDPNVKRSLLRMAEEAATEVVETPPASPSPSSPAKTAVRWGDDDNEEDAFEVEELTEADIETLMEEFELEAQSKPEM